MMIISTSQNSKKIMTKNEAFEIPKISFDSKGELVITATETSSKHDFDFFEGKWQLKNKKLKSRLNNCTDWIEFDSTQEMYRVLNGIGNIDNFLATFDSEPFEGMTVRLFNPKTKLWSIYWADSNEGKLDPPVLGSFENNVGHFITKDTFNGTQILVIFRWDAREKNNPVWTEQIFQLKSVNTGSIRCFNIIVIIIVIDPVNDTYPERHAVSKFAEVYPFNVKMFNKTQVPFGF